MKAKVTQYNSNVGYYSAITENRTKVVFSLIEPTVLNLDSIKLMSHFVVILEKLLPKRFPKNLRNL